MNAYVVTTDRSVRGLKKFVIVHRSAAQAHAEVADIFSGYVMRKCSLYRCPECGAASDFETNGEHFTGAQYSLLCTSCGLTADPNA